MKGAVGLALGTLWVAAGYHSLLWVVKLLGLDPDRVLTGHPVLALCAMIFLPWAIWFVLRIAADWAWSP